MATPTHSQSVSCNVLKGLRVLDFGRYVAAPYCAMLLADMGAEVIRVERPGGEEDRRVGLTAANRENLLYPSMARNKKAITLDYARAESLRVLGDLVASSDIFLHNFSPSAALGLNLGYEQIKAFEPRIIYAAISCYGSSGPYAERIGFDPMAQMLSGAAAVTGTADEPIRSGVPWVDYSTGLCAALGILAALRHRDLTGEGQSVDCALLQTAVSFTTPVLAEATVMGLERPRLRNQGAYLAPANLYECSDGRVYLAVVTNSMWRALVRIIGKPELAQAPELANGELRYINAERIEAPLREWMASRQVDAVVDEMARARVPCARYLTTAEVREDPQVRACSMVAEADLREPGLERVPVSQLPIRFSKTSLATVRPPPRVGEHNVQIYREMLGYDEADYQGLESAGVI